MELHILIREKIRKVLFITNFSVCLHLLPQGVGEELILEILEGNFFSFLTKLTFLIQDSVSHKSEFCAKDSVMSQD